MDPTELKRFQAFLEILQEMGVREYTSPTLQLKLDRRISADTSVDISDTAHKPTPVLTGFDHPSLWPDGKKPTFPR